MQSNNSLHMLGLDICGAYADLLEEAGSSQALKIAAQR